jgi:hypothetical protein
LFNTTTTEPPGSGQIRLDNATQPSATKLWISFTTAPGADVRNLLLYAFEDGNDVYIQDKDDSSRWIIFELTSDPVDKTTYGEWTVVFKAAGPNSLAAQRVLISAKAPTSAAGISDAPSDGNTYGRKDAAWIDLASDFALLDSPTFTGDPKAPTPTAGDNDTSIATTAFVTAADDAVKSQLIGTASSGMDTLGEIENYIAANITPTLGNKADVFSPTFTGDPKAPTPATVDNDTSIATTAYVKANLANYQPLDGDLTAIAALTGTNSIYFRSGTDTWSPVTMGGNMTFSGGVLNSTAAGGTALAPQAGRLTYVSATALKFAPYGGNKIQINGAQYTIPNAGIAGLANTGVFVNGVAGQNLAANTTYYLYAFVNSGTVTGDFRTDGNGHITDITSGNEGVEVRCSSGTTPDPTRTLIGLIRTNASSQFADSATQRFVRSWFNPKKESLSGSLTTNRSTTSTTFVELHSEIRVNFLSWAGELIDFICAGTAWETSPNPGIVALALDATTTRTGAGCIVPGIGSYIAIAPTFAKTDASEGFHFVTLIGLAGQSCTLNANADLTDAACTIIGMLTR